MRTSSYYEFPFAPNVLRTLFRWCNATVDFDVWVEFFDEGFEITESDVFAWKYV